jgi:hypothetical protein
VLLGRIRRLKLIDPEGSKAMEPIAGKGFYATLVP